MSIIILAFFIINIHIPTIIATAHSNAYNLIIYNEHLYNIGMYYKKKKMKMKIKIDIRTICVIHIMYGKSIENSFYVIIEWNE